MFFDMEQSEPPPTGPGADAEPVLVSACLRAAPAPTRGDNRDMALEARLVRDGRAGPVLPRGERWPPDPRPAANLTARAADVLDGAGRVVSIEGDDVTDAFLAGAALALDGPRRDPARLPKERSPSCGCEATHVDGVLVEGRGVTASCSSAAESAEGVEGGRRPGSIEAPPQSSAM